MLRARCPTSDASELRSTGGGARRAIPWHELDVRALGAAGRAQVGATWRERMKQEHLAVGAFALLARELAEEGCDPLVLSLVTRASSDEVRHAEICRAFAARLLGEEKVPSGFRGLPHVPMHTHARPAQRVLFHVVEMCCISETLTGVYLTEMVARATKPIARAAIESLLEDEIDHGRVGWAYLASRARATHTDGLAETIPAMLDRTFRPVCDSAPAPADDAKLEEVGYLRQSTSREVYARALRDVILPGFETLGVDLGPARKLVRERGWG